jgi:FtsP/CotA-like multicopper oxidase with cupredoxin domain
LINIAPDEPFGGFDPEGPVADPETTGQVMEFRVGAIVGADATTPPERLVLPALPEQAPLALTRPLSLNELMSMHIKVPFDLAADAPVLLAFDPATNQLVTDDAGVFVVYDEAVHTSYIAKLVSLTPEMEAKLPAGVTAEMFGPVAAFMGTMDADGQPVPKPWADPVTETPARNTSEVWEFHNFTADAHPIHVHLVQFQVLNREPMGDPGAGRGPEGWETGMKDTVISYPGEITRIRATFDLAGRYVWHCHIIEHEDNEMMRPFRVL